MTKANEIFGIIYGPAKRGKTVAAIRSFPTGFFISPKGGMLSSNWLGWEPKSVEATGFDQIMNILSKPHNHPAIIIDDFSIIADAELGKLKKTHRGWSAFDVFNAKVYELRDCAREANCHVILIMHEQPPREVKKEGGGKYIPGAPLIPGWQLPEKLPALADFVARVVHTDDFPGPWPFVFQTGPDQNYITGDRLAITPPLSPMNLGETLRAAGYTIPRPEPLLWMEDAVEKISQLLVQQMQKEEPNFQPILKAAATKLTAKVSDKRHIRWALLDSFDRAYLKIHSTNLVDDFIESFDVAI